MFDELLSTFQQDANVFVVDWAGGAKKIVYYKAVANTRVVAALIVQFIQALEAHARTKPADITLIGHSLGAHISGYVGEDIHGIGRITGWLITHTMFSRSF